MKKVLITICAVILVVLIAFLGYQVYNGIVNSKPGESQSQSTPQNGENQPPPNNTKNTYADMLTAIDRAKKSNEDTIGWIKIPGTQIDNSVLQSHNNDYYLRLTEDKKYDVYGCYFLDYECFTGTREQISRSNVIYGHSDLENNPKGFRFSQLFNFTSPEFAQKTPYIYYSTAEEYMVWQVIAVAYTDTKMPYIQVNADDKMLTSVVEETKSKSLYTYADASYDPATDKILFLSTCSVKYGARPDERFVVLAKLVPADAELLDNADLQINENPVQPNFG